MKVVIAGSRSIKDPEVIQKAVAISGFLITEVVTGGAEGVDKLADQWAHDNKIDRTIMPANWGRHGKAGGYQRNEKMVSYGDAVICIWDGKSKGTAHTIKIAENQRKRCTIYIPEGLATDLYAKSVIDHENYEEAK